MKRFVTLAHGSLVSGFLVADGDSKGPIVWLNGGSDGVIMPGVVKGSKHEVSEVAVGKSSGDQFKGKRFQGLRSVAVGDNSFVVGEKWFGFRVAVIQSGWCGSDGSECLMNWEFMAEKWPGEGGIIRELDGGGLVLN
jgi:hypothetical protein